MCPFCYLGCRQLRDALDQFEHAPAVIVRHHAFELDPHSPLSYPGTLNELLAEKYDTTLNHAQELNAQMQARAEELGLRWHLDLVQPANTFNAHRLVALAASQNLQDQMLDRLFRAYFSEGALISDFNTLSTLARQVGVLGADATLSGNEFTDQVRHDENLAAQMGIQGVPAFIFDGRIHVSGAQGVNSLLESLHTAWAGRQKLTV